MNSSYQFDYFGSYLTHKLIITATIDDDYDYDVNVDQKSEKRRTFLETVYLVVGEGRTVTL